MPVFLGTKSPDIFFNHLKFLRNDLLHNAIYREPEIKKIINFLKTQSGVNYVQMSGSGTTCFGLFNNSKNSKIAFKNVKKHFPDYWCEITESINS
jgi:4-diphosphocytidyl-2-C-methyl-D-erythritol kinase